MNGLGYETGCDPGKPGFAQVPLRAGQGSAWDHAGWRWWPAKGRLRRPGTRQAIRQATARDILQFDPAFECFEAHFKTVPPLKILVPPLGLVIAITSPQASR